VEPDSEFSMFFWVHNELGRSRAFAKKTGSGVLFILHSVNLTMVFVVYASFQQESIRSWNPTFLLKQEQEANVINTGVRVESDPEFSIFRQRTESRFFENPEQERIRSPIS